MATYVATVEYSIDVTSDRPSSGQAEDLDIANAIRTELQVAIEKSGPDIQSAMSAGLLAEQEAIRIMDFTAEVLHVKKRAGS
jgi:hypothetical protein